jgi:hypothetical protein
MANKPFPLRAGIDEVATETAACDGFTVFCLPEAFVTEFTAETKKLLKAAGISSFHGVDCKDANSKAYADFLSLAHAFLRKSPQSFTACRMFSPKVKAELQGFGDLLVKGAIEQALGTGHPAVSGLQPYFLPLATLAAVSRELAPSSEVRIDMDEHSSFGDLAAVAHQVGGTSIMAATLLKAMYNAYARKLHDRTPLLPDDGVKVMKDSKSALIQAADVIGHFAMNYMFMRLGHTSKKKVLRGKMLADAFGSDVDAFDPTGKATLSGNDFALVDEGSFTFKVSWQITKPPADPALMNEWPKDDGFLSEGSKRAGEN